MLNSIFVQLDNEHDTKSLRTLNPFRVTKQKKPKTFVIIEFMTSLKQKSGEFKDVLGKSEKAV